MDGKGLRGMHGEELPGVRLVAGYAVKAGLALAQEGVRRDEQDCELNAAMRLLEQIQLQGLVLTGDARYAQRRVCEFVLDRGGHYLVVVKQNQPQLYEDIARLLEQPALRGGICQGGTKRGATAIVRN